MRDPVFFPSIYRKGGGSGWIVTSFSTAETIIIFGTGARAKASIDSLQIQNTSYLQDDEN